MSHGPFKEYVVDGAILHCPFTSSPITLKATDVRTVKIQSKAVCTEEDKQAINNNHSECIKTLKPCVPILMAWINPRGQAANVLSNGHIRLLDDATIRCSRGDVPLTFVNSGQISTIAIPGSGVISLPKEVREAGFAVRHPIEAWNIGAHSPGSNNLSTLAVLFANGMGWKQDKLTEGTLTNAFRHTIWQAMISNEYGNDYATQVGSVHEDHPLLLRQIEACQKGGLVVCTLLTTDEADEIIDLKNNIIGRYVGLNNPGKSNSELAKVLLRVFYSEGLYMLDVKNEDYCQIVLKKIDEDTLNKSLENIDNGLNHGDKERQNERG